MIISASRRTDIPAFYSEWFFNRLKEGYVIVGNPYNNGDLSRPSSRLYVTHRQFDELSGIAASGGDACLLSSSVWGLSARMMVCAERLCTKSIM